MPSFDEMADHGAGKLKNEVGGYLGLPSLYRHQILSKFIKTSKLC